MIQKQFDAITKEDIDALVTDQVCEKRTIEYKQELPGNTDENKREFLADVSSFANAGGGDLVFGITESDGIPVEAKGLNCVSDSEILRLESMIRDGLEPRIIGVHTKPIEGFTVGCILIMRIPKSWNAPHIIKFKNYSRFYTRNSAGKYQMDVTEIRSAFLLSESLSEKMRQFRDDRLSKILANETPVSLSENPGIALHLLPLESFTSNNIIDMTYFSGYNHILKVAYGGNNGSRFNLDGVVAQGLQQEDGKIKSYCQFYRTGQLEHVDRAILAYHSARSKFLPIKNFEVHLINALASYLVLLKKLDISCPIIVSLCLFGAKDICWMNNDGDFTLPIDREILILPEITISEYPTELNSVETRKDEIDNCVIISKMIKPILDSLWNAAGKSKCFNYTTNGEYILE